MTEINIPYSPRPLQRELHNRLQDTRWSVVVCHRRFGKTVMAINHLLRDAILTAKPNPRFAYIAPTYRQAKSVAWDYLKQFAGTIPMVRFHETELRCDLPNGSRIQLLGAETRIAYVAYILMVRCWMKWLICPVSYTHLRAHET